MWSRLRTWFFVWMKWLPSAIARDGLGFDRPRARGKDRDQRRSAKLCRLVQVVLRLINGIESHSRRLGLDPASPTRSARNRPVAGKAGSRPSLRVESTLTESWKSETGRSTALFGLTGQFVDVRHRLSQPGDLLLLGLDERVEQGDLAGVVALLVLAEAEEVRLVLGPPAVEVQLVLGVDRLAEGLDLVVVGPVDAQVRLGPVVGVGRRVRRRPSIVRAVLAGFEARDVETAS